eukprot:scaffold167459_cov70-Attheya_sp.AAC.7
MPQFIIHHSEQVVQFIQSTGAEILYITPYSPYLNPTIKLMFANYKQMLKDDYCTPNRRVVLKYYKYYLCRMLRKSLIQATAQRANDNGKPCRCSRIERGY